MEAKEMVQGMIDRARIAQKEFEKYPQEKVDKAVRAVGKIIYDNADPLAKMAVEETGMGVYEHKINKNTAKPVSVWHHLKHIKSRGIIERDEEHGIVKVARPIGVIGSVTPTTNPIVTPCQNSMIALKGGNAVIVCPHPKAKKCGTKTVNLMRSALKEIGAPEDLIQIVEEPSSEISNLVMSMCDACVSTGGPGMVKAAYSSGKPAYGVGAGNVQVLVGTDADIPKVAQMVIQGRTSDLGILCTGEQAIHVHESQYDEMIEALKANGAYIVVDEKEKALLSEAIFPGGGRISPKIVGLKPHRVAEIAGFSVPEETSVLVMPVTGTGADEPMSQEKLCPTMVIYKYNTWEEAVENANQNLLNMGAGHSCIMHTNDKKKVEYAAGILPVCRFAVNIIGPAGLGGGPMTGLTPTSTIGCGSWGGNSISENLAWYHLVNICRIAYRIDNRQPSDEEVWAEE